jgi:hypothetical protein
MNEDSRLELSEVNVSDRVECVRRDDVVIRSTFVGFVKARDGMLAKYPGEKYYLAEFGNGKCVRTDFIRSFRRLSPKERVQ